MRTIVIGGGIAGMVAARDRALAGDEVVLLEAGDRLGGRVVKDSLAGIDIDGGVDRFASYGAELPALLRELHLDDDLVHPEPLPLWLATGDRTAVPLPRPSLAGIPGVPLARETIAAIGGGAAMRAQLDALLPGVVAAKATTLADLVGRRMGAVVRDRLVAPAVRARFGAEPALLAPEEVHPGLRSALLGTGNLAGAVSALASRAPGGSFEASLRGGLFRLVEALEAQLHRFGVEVRLGARAVRMTDGGVETEGGIRIRGRAILAAPLGEEPGGQAVHVILAFDADELARTPRGTGVLPASEERGVRELRHLTAEWAWLASATPLQLVRLSYAPDAAPTVEGAHHDAERLLGTVLPQPADARIVASAPPGAPALDEHAIDGMHVIDKAGTGVDVATAVARARSVARGIDGGGTAHGG